MCLFLIGCRRIDFLCHLQSRFGVFVWKNYFSNWSKKQTEDEKENEASEAPAPVIDYSTLPVHDESQRILIDDQEPLQIDAPADDDTYSLMPGAPLSKDEH